jgi:ribose transport system substrate-binding protein
MIHLTSPVLLAELTSCQTRRAIGLSSSDEPFIQISGAVVGRQGFEPWTNGLKGRCSTAELPTRSSAGAKGTRVCPMSKPVFRDVRLRIIGTRSRCVPGFLLLHDRFPFSGQAHSILRMKPRYLAMAVLCCAWIAQAADSYTIAVIPKGTTHEFWKSIHAGAVKAQRELDGKGTKVRLFWKGPLREDDRDQQIQVVENFTSRRVSGIVLAPLDSRALVNPVASARQAGVPTVVMDSDLNSDAQVSFVATDNFKGGQMGADHLAKLLGGKGNVLLLRYQVGSASTEAREAGFLDAIQKYPDIKLVSSDQYAGATRELAYQAAQNLLNRFGNQIQGVFCPCEPVTVTMTKALQDRGLAKGKVKLVGFDAGSQSVKDLAGGDIHALVVQNPVKMGYLGVMTLVEHLQGKPVEKRIDTGVTIATRENMKEPEVHELLNPPLKKYLDE